MFITDPFITDPFITDPFITDPFVTDHVDNGTLLNVLLLHSKWQHKS